MEKKSSHNNFIGIYDNYLSPKYIEDLKNFFYKNYNNKDVTENRSKKFSSGVVKEKELAILVEDKRIYPNFVPDKFKDYFYKNLFQKILTDEYSKTYQNGYGQLLNDWETFCSGFLLQETQPGQGYHIWHSEWACGLGSDLVDEDMIRKYYAKRNEPLPEGIKLPEDQMVESVADRILAYTLYLNDVEEGGETEFLYQHTRVKPKAGRIVIFPAAPTHVHRGNPPLTGSKLLLTGWVRMTPCFIK